MIKVQSLNLLQVFLYLIITTQCEEESSMNSDELKQKIQEVWLSQRVCDSFYSLGKRQPVSEEFYHKLVR